MRRLLLLILILAGCATKPPVVTEPPAFDPVAAFYAAEGSDIEPVRAGDLQGVLLWDNRVGRPVGEHPETYHHSFTAEEVETFQGYPFYCFAGRPGFTDIGYSNARMIAGDAPVIFYWSILHNFLPEYYDETPWPVVAHRGQVLSGQHVLGTDGQPIKRWYRDYPNHSPHDSYLVDDRTLDPKVFADNVYELIQKYPVEGLFLDYFAEKPWPYPQDKARMPDREDNWKSWRDWQIQFTYELRQMVGPDFLLIGNGPWAMKEAKLVQSWLLSGVFWERMATHWWTPEEVREMTRDRPGLHLYGPRQGNKAGGVNIREFAREICEREQGIFIFTR